MKENEKTNQKMYYRMLGGTGLQVSVLSFGFWATYGVKEGSSADRQLSCYERTDSLEAVVDQLSEETMMDC